MIFLLTGFCLKLLNRNLCFARKNLNNSHSKIYLKLRTLSNKIVDIIILLCWRNRCLTFLIQFPKNKIIVLQWQANFNWKRLALMLYWLCLSFNLEKDSNRYIRVVDEINLSIHQIEVWIWIKISLIFQEYWFEQIVLWLERIP